MQKLIKRARKEGMMNFHFSAKFIDYDIKFHGVAELDDVLEKHIKGHEETIIALCRAELATLCKRWGTKPADVVFFEIYYFKQAIFSKEIYNTGEEVKLFKWEK